jgi:hypothetical protein
MPYLCDQSTQLAYGSVLLSELAPTLVVLGHSSRSESSRPCKHVQTRTHAVEPDPDRLELPLVPFART